MIVPCLNAEATLALQLEALACQELSDPWELIIADNGSTDASREIARKFETRFAQMRVIQTQGSRRLAARARNAGVQESQSEFLAFCDADDEISPGWVAAMVRALSQHEVVCGQFRFDKFNDLRTAMELTDAWKDGLFKGRFLPGGGSGNLGIRRRTHDLIGGFDECLPHGEDADYFWRLQLEGFKLYVEPRAIVQVRVGRVNPSMASTFRRNKNRVASNLWSYKRYRRWGMLPPPTFEDSARKWFRLIRGTFSAVRRGRQQRTIWLEQMAYQTGDLVGQLQGRLTNPCKPYEPRTVSSN